MCFPPRFGGAWSSISPSESIPSRSVAVSGSSDTIPCTDCIAEINSIWYTTTSPTGIAPFAASIPAVPRTDTSPATMIAASSAPNMTVRRSTARLPSFRPRIAERGESAKRRSASSARRKGSERKKSKSAANAPSLFWRTLREFEANRRAKGMKRTMQAGMNAMNDNPSADERVWSAKPAANIVTRAVTRRG